MPQGYASNYDVRVTIYREERDGQPIVFESASRSGPRQGWTSVVVQRAINTPARVTIQVPGYVDRPGRRWSDEISQRDYVQIDATVRRVPDTDSEPWQTIFFGTVETLTFNEAVPDSTTTITATCPLGVMASENFQYWNAVPGYFGGVGASQVASGAGKLRQLYASGRNETNIFATIADMLVTTFDAFVDTLFPIARRINGKPILWRDTYAYRFESDTLGIDIKLDSFAPEATTWLSTVQGLAEVPMFYELYSELEPTTILDDASPSGLRVLAKPAQTTFPFVPRINRRSGSEVRRLAEVVRVRPKPFPVYYSGKNGAIEGYDARAWDSLPTITVRAHGAMSATFQRATDTVYTYFETQQASLYEPTMAANALQRVIFDTGKYAKLKGYAPLAPQTRRYPYVPAGQPKPEGYISINGMREVETNAINFFGLLNEQLFSYHQFNDLFEQGNLMLPIDLRPKLGHRLLYDNRLGYIEGYTHSFSPTEASTSVTLSRVLTQEHYARLPKELGRKRIDEEFAPQVGGQNIQRAANAVADAREV